MILTKLIKIYKKYHQDVRIILFKNLSNNKNVEGKPLLKVPSLFVGNGRITFQDNVQLGYFPSPNFYDGTIYIESRNKDAEVIFGANIFINNNFRLICDKTKITISDNVLIGTNVEIIDSDFHEINPEFRNRGNHVCEPVIINKNVFIGSNCVILKGVTIGENSVLANGAVVTKNIPANVIAGGNPARIIKNISDEK